MNLRFTSLRALFTQQGTSRLAAAAALAFALAGGHIASALAAPTAAASAPDAASASYAAGSQLTVRAGQSLNDLAIAVTQSHDRATLARASRALFDANPNAFMSHDPSRMRLGAVLTVPALDATGAPASDVAAAAAPTSAVSAPAVVATTAAAAAATGVASGVAQVNAAAASAASAASAAAHAAAPATSAGSGAASGVAETGAALTASSVASASGAAASAPMAGSQAAALPASGTHEWAGSIQSSASEPVGGASAAVTGAAGAQSASQPRTQVSSLQQLLALKNRVLMELQKHGIGGTPVVATGAAPSNGAQPVAGASAAATVPGHGGAAVATSPTVAGMSQSELSIAAAVGAALVVLLAALRMRRRRRQNAAAEAATTSDEAAASARLADSEDVAVSRDGTPVHPASEALSNDEAAQHAAAQASAERKAAEREAAESEAAARAEAERVAAEREAEIRREAAREVDEREAAAKAEAEREAAAHPVASAEEPNPSQHQNVWQERPATSVAIEPTESPEEIEPAAHIDVPVEPLPVVHHEQFDSATSAASLAAAAELGAEALPLTRLEPVDEAVPQEEPARRLQWDDEAPPAGSLDHTRTPAPVLDFTPQHLEPRAAEPFGQPYSDASAHPVPETSVPAVPLVHQEPQAHQDLAHSEPSYQPHLPPTSFTSDIAPAPEPAAVVQAEPILVAPTEFPRDAVDAFGSLDMPLPPRVESTADNVHAPVSLTTQPVVSPETTAQQAFAPHDPDDAPHIADEIEAGTAGHAAVAGLGAGGFGAAGFGALKLDFDLELPPSPAQPLPAFTTADLGRIARNKLDLAAEYIELGDLSGARALINEVIETNDPATRTEARGLLSTLAPLS